MIGGIDGYGRSLREVEIYDIALDTWFDGPLLPEAVHHPAVAADGQHIYVVGGFTGISYQPRDVFYVYDPVSNAWTEGGHMNDFRASAAGAMRDGFVTVVGGVTPSGTAKSSEWYDPNTKGWNGLNDMSVPREQLAVIGIDKRLYALGGRNGSLEKNTGAFEVYGVNGPHWETLPEMPTPRSGFAAALSGGKIWAFGGESKDGTIAPVETFDLWTQKWETFPQPLPAPRHGLAAVPYGNRIYVIGGGRRSGFSVSDMNQVLILAEPAPLPEKK